MDLSQSQKHENSSGLGVLLLGSTDSHDESNLGFGINEDVSFLSCLGGD